MFTLVSQLVCLSIISALEPTLAGFSSSQIELPWQQYFPPTKSHWKLPKSGRPERFRLGKGRFRVTHKGADIDCEFPPSTLILSNINWERADLGANGNLDIMYKTLGESREFAVIGRPKGSTLHFFGHSPLDRGLYRCMATALDPIAGRTVTVFQDVPFFPNFRWNARLCGHLKAQIA
uniref:Uncharacterized protein n=1 Tax=Rhodnius prolixus TaxID=13249 RepID=T1HLR5_RHOPR